MKALHLLEAINAYKVFDEASRIAWGQELMGTDLTCEEWTMLNRLCDKVCEGLTAYIDKQMEGEK